MRRIAMFNRDVRAASTGGDTFVPVTISIAISPTKSPLRGFAMTFQSMRVCTAGLAIALVSFAAPAVAQDVTFTEIRDAVPDKFFDPVNTRSETPNTLNIAFDVIHGFKASTVRPILSPDPAADRAMDTISFNVNAPEGYYVSSIAYHQRGENTIIEIGRASGASSWVIDGQPNHIAFFRTDPRVDGTVTFTDSRLRVVPVSITTGIFVFEVSGAATVELTSATVVVTVAPVSPDPNPKQTATIAVSGFTGTYDGDPHGATGTATGVNNEDLTNLLHFVGTFMDAPGGTANWTFSGNANYSAAEGTAAITINPADATIVVDGYTGTYDGAEHGATGSATGVNNDEDLTGLLNLGETFMDAPGGTANWTFLGNANYNRAAGTALITINPADATIVVSGYTGTYDDTSHGATGTATGVQTDYAPNGESLTSLLNLGASFKDAPGGTANWTFSGGPNYNDAAGTADITISKATSIVTWPQPAAIPARTALTTTQLNATANVGGAFVYSPPLGTELTTTQTLSVVFTPADTVNYAAATATVTITVTHGNSAKNKKG
jgi:hypothetical protein